MSRRRNRGKAKPFGTSKHRAARVQRFKAKNPDSFKPAGKFAKKKGGHGDEE